jgi:DNA-directed RNA polymerase specialized sigma24 family protein
MQIRDFTQTEADYLETVCNFTQDENALFQLRLKDIPLEECAERMNRSLDSVKQLSRRVNHKIMREI